MNDHQEQDFEPRNELERQLLATHEGSISAEEFIRALPGAQVFMPIEDNLGIEGLQESQRAAPLSLEAEDGTQVLILFTSPERAKPFLQDYPGFAGGILEDLRWVLQKMGGGYGVAINPGWHIGIDLDPEMVTQLARQAAAKLQ